MSLYILVVLTFGSQKVLLESKLSHTGTCLIHLSICIYIEIFFVIKNE